MHTLVIGGSRGIGWELAKVFAAVGDTVTVTGRKAPDRADSIVAFCELNLSTSDYADTIRMCINDQQKIGRIVYAHGYFQEGTITDLSEAEIQDMIQVCGTGFVFVTRNILLKQGELPECVVITSSSQWTPRELEPVYNFAKAGVGHFAHALSFDARVGKTMVAAPTGTKTAFHASRTDVDMSTYHDPAWVAQHIYEQIDGEYEYKLVKILRNPATVEVADIR